MNEDKLMPGAGRVTIITEMPDKNIPGNRRLVLQRIVDWPAWNSELWPLVIEEIAAAAISAIRTTRSKNG